MWTQLLKLHCMLLVGLLFGSGKAAGLLDASLAVIEAGGVAARQQEQMAVKAVLDMVPASARGSFLLYQLAKAINSGNYPWLEPQRQFLGLELQEQEQELIVEQQVDVVDSSWMAAMANEFQYVPVYENFPLDLQTWLMDSYSLDAIDVYDGWMRSTRRSGVGGQEICNAAGQCFEVAQIVGACCPF
ncbi:uncharacterized protein LOC133842949 [Drosophila sulfurigaster albostrigata]|uniref:uncharacterized protein LOC133842949 n=1 Tax=Drosophila sulfurigaster albostrigata TaxID=89887 RepID=UPI002D21B59E|nr:uncharacterized protein LOC133842949 [Drosophila sulfurigaster albostrigata]